LPAVVWANVATQAVNRVAVRLTLRFGMSLMTVELLYVTQVSADGS
jgi:hypothetical protein